MITCWLEKGDGSKLELPTLLEWKFCYGTGTPCDSFFVRCLWESGRENELPHAARFYARWGQERVFTGVVDELTCVCGGDGLCLEVSGRGMAALLLDNEAMPARYQRATWADILFGHVLPCGVSAMGGAKLPAVSDFSVGSGVSEWSVVQEFAQYYGGVVPRFDRMGRLVVTPHEDGTPFFIGPSAPVTEWEYRIKRYGVLNRVAVRRMSAWDTQWVEDEAATARGICARRITTVPSETDNASMRYSADYQLRASRSGERRLTVTLVGAFLAWPGQLAQVNLTGFGGNGTYRVAQTEVVCDGNGVTTTLVLGEPDSMI